MNDQHDPLVMAKLWGIAKASDSNADDLNVMLPDENDPADQTNRLWLGCSFGLTIRVDAIPPALLSQLGPFETKAATSRIRPTNYEKLGDFLRERPELLRAD
jgi:hypothetical protein